MIVYSVMMLGIALLCGYFAVSVGRGNTDLINCYHEDRVKDKKIYCSKIAECLWILAGGLGVSGMVALCRKEKPVIMTALILTVSSVLLSTVRLFYVQKKYGGGIF